MANKPQPLDLLDKLDQMEAVARRIGGEQRGAVSSAAKQVLRGIDCLYRALGSGDLERVAAFGILLGESYRTLAVECAAALSPEERSAIAPKVAAAERRRSAKVARATRAAKADQGRDANRNRALRLLDQERRRTPKATRDTLVKHVAKAFKVTPRTIYRWLATAE